MPYSIDNPPDRIKALPKHAQEIFIAAFNSASEQYGADDEGRLNAIAWAAVEQKYEKNDAGEWVEIKSERATIARVFEQFRELLKPLLEFVHPRDTHAAQIVTRQADGKYRWAGVAATAVINRDGMIDSRALFDSFIERIEKTGEYPLYDVLHLGDDCVIGKCDFVMRDGAVYFASGTFNDDEFSQACARELARNPEYWGHSISFLSGKPSEVDIYGISIPVFDAGINSFISVVPRDRAASLFTGVAVQQERGNMTEEQFTQLVKLVGREMADKKRTELDQLNRTIEEAGLILRQSATPTEPKAEEPKPADAQERAEEPKPAEGEAKTETQPEPENRVDDPMVQELLTAVTALSAQIKDLMTAFGMMQEEQKQIAERMAAVERDDKEKLDAVLADAPETRTAVLTRARDARANTTKVDPAETLGKLHSQRKIKFS